MGREDLLSEILTLARNYEREPDSLVTVYQEAMAELWGNTRVEKAQLPPPTPDGTLAVLREAELLCVDHLEGEE